MISKSIQFLLLFSPAFLYHAFADPPYEICSTSTTHASGSSFQNNLNNILLSLSFNSSISKSYNVSYGNDTDKVYSLYMCLAYVSNATCQDCIATATQDILKLCPQADEAVIWEEVCQLRYSNMNFFGKLNVTGNIGKDNQQNISEPHKFESVVNGLLNSLTQQASSNVSANFYATGEVPLEDKTVHALVQCTRDLSDTDCSQCLKSAMRDIPGCCYASIGARVLSRSCYLRYEFYPFYDGATGPTNSSTNINNASTTRMITGIVVAAVLALIVSSCSIYFVMKKKTKRSKNRVHSHMINSHSFGQQSETMFHGRNDKISEEFPSIDFATLSAATKNFSAANKLGQGGFGLVYKGILHDGQEAAIKRFSACSEQGSEEFINEILLISKLQHRNLVRLLGFCVDGEEKLLVYEYLSNGSLDSVLFDPKQRAKLDWSRRLDIIGGIGRGIPYLHEDSRLKIIHRDLKASNVLLDYDMSPKVSDFGMARTFVGSEGEANTATIVETYGYMASEYAMEEFYSIKSDVYAFGVLLLEIITGRRNAGFYQSKNAPSLLAYAWLLWNEGNGLELIDPLLSDSCPEDQFLRYIHVGLLCVQEDAYDRPTMSSVFLMLKNESANLGEPERPPFSVGRFTKNDQDEPESERWPLNDLISSDISGK